MSLFREYDLVLAAQVHECEQAEKSVVICIEISIVVWNILRVPQGIHELLVDAVICQKSGGCYSGYKAYGVSENL